MCGRFTLTAPPDDVAALLALAELDPFPPRYNIAPTQPILIAIGGQPERPGANLPNRTALIVRWGLIPSWVKDVKAFPLLINARAETASGKNAFRGAMRGAVGTAVSVTAALASGTPAPAASAGSS